ncbi:peptide/nickel transport system permease protein [Rhodoglobus vestalii]|uniref:Peptide/nickel transport system permease protein n=1 Tax=Rhodoglobus vestalii TaxID=193384 RepID=A0A8H2K6M3_9MICO|nr:ABC transporter permease [Rhodoglobus vestalii]TQO19827.1 peptide/nickel transport system permease protein [Rhodoglobus vestalii]
MLSFAIKRGLSAILVLFTVITVIFTVTHLIPSDPARVAAGLTATPEQIEQTKIALGLDRPFFEQYLDYLGGLLRGDFGVSYTSQQNMGPVLALAIPATLELVIYSFLIYIVLGIGAGILWAATAGTWIASVLRGLVSLCSGVPVFWMAIVLQIWLAGALGWFPINGRLEIATQRPAHVTGLYLVDTLLAGQGDIFVEAAHHLVLPVLTLVIWMFALAARLTQKSIMNELVAPYVLTAEGKGAKPSRVLFAHVLRNALNPIITVVGMQFGWLLGGTVLVEVVFSWPGLGTYMYSALKNFDFPVVTAVAIVVTLGFVIVNTLIDFIYPILDPRVRQV